jgi:hypothetical protein
MKSLLRIAFMLAPVALLAGCGGAQSSLTERSGSSMSSEATSQDLLYVTNGGSNEVYVYSFPAGTQVGTLTGFNAPAGACIDSSQNIWIVNAGTNDILEYAHGGTAPITTLHDPAKYPPFACAVDPGTGNLAITNAEPPYGHGGVMIYKNASGTPKHYEVPTVPHLYYDGYDNSGNLFVDGLIGRCCRHGGPRAAFAELANGSKSFVGISLSGGAFYPRPGGVQWDGKYITVLNVNVIYEIQISGSHGSVVGSTTLQGTYDSDVDPTWIAGKYVAASYSDPSSQNWGAGIWTYPKGKTVQTLQGSFDDSRGVAVSLGGSKQR